MPPDFGQGGSMPPDMSFPPQGAENGMPAHPDMNGGPGGMQGMQQRETEPPAQETPAAEATAEAVVTGPQPVSTSTWLMLGACALVLILGVLFAMKYRP
jgi:hypothetical protein